MLTMALTIFVDIRGFTTWCADSDVHAHVVEFVDGFDKILNLKLANDFHIKQLGDGAMLVRQLKEDELPITIIEGLLEIIDDVNHDFSNLCDRFYTMHGVNTHLHLGWGITRGDVWTRDTSDGKDFVGKNINEAARLCSKARPYGTVIDADDFRELPESYRPMFQKFKLELDEFKTVINIWVTDKIADVINPTNQTHGNPQVFVSGLCVRHENNILEVLVMKRDHHREFFPGRLELTTGGLLGKDEAFTDGVSRYFREELALEVDVDSNNFMTYQFSNRQGELTPGVRYLCRHISGQPLLVHYEEFNWVTVEKLKSMPDEDFLPGMKKDALSLIEKIETY